MRTITAYPPTDDPIIVGLCSSLTKLVNAKYYIKLRTSGHGSGFPAEALTAADARTEARKHLRKYPTWERATVLERHHWTA